MESNFQLQLFLCTKLNASLKISLINFEINGQILIELHIKYIISCLLYFSVTGSFFTLEQPKTRSIRTKPINPI